MIHKQRMSWITIRTASFCLQVAVTLRFGPSLAWPGLTAGCVKYFQREVGELKLHAVLYSLHSYTDMMACFERVPSWQYVM